ncbi:MAG: ACT domain-containing protein [Clostridia bacterium]|nr:ACT domain-containing protein [Clostridia bacterium]
MSVEQISVFLDNKAGRLSEVTDVLAKAGINMSALSIADTTHFGILRLIVNRPDEAEKVLKESGFTVSKTDVLAIAIDDTAGSLAGALRMLTDSGISIEYIYAFVTRKADCAMVVLKIEDEARAVELFKANGVRVLTESEVSEL